MKANQSGDPVKVVKSDNFALGIALRAAARQSAGRQLSPFEERLLKSFKVFADDEEIAEYGKIFNETKNSRALGDAQLFPDVVLRVPDDKPYTKSDFLRDAKELAPEMLAAPNNKIVDLAKLDDQRKAGKLSKLDNQPGSDPTEYHIDNEEYSDAVREAGGGVTVFTSSNPEITAAPSKQYSVCLVRFWCRKKGYDGGGKQEIYWCISGGIDNGAMEKYYTEEFGSIEDDTIRNIPPGKYNLINGPVKANAAGHIELWEADDSSGGFYNSMRNALADAAEYCVDAAVDAQDWVDDEGADGPALVALVGILLALFGKLMELVTNDDDFICRRTFAWSRQALWDFAASGKNLVTDFIGEGRAGSFNLQLKCLTDLG